MIRSLRSSDWIPSVINYIHVISEMSMLLVFSLRSDLNCALVPSLDYSSTWHIRGRFSLRKKHHHGDSPSYIL